MRYSEIGEGIFTSPTLHPEREHRIRQHTTGLRIIGNFQKFNTSCETFALELAKGVKVVCISIGTHRSGRRPFWRDIDAAVATQRSENTDMDELACGPAHYTVSSVGPVAPDAGSHTNRRMDVRLVRTRIERAFPCSQRPRRCPERSCNLRIGVGGWSDVSQGRMYVEKLTNPDRQPSALAQSLTARDLGQGICALRVQ